MDNSVDLPGYKHYVDRRRPAPRGDGLLPRHRRAIPAPWSTASRCAVGVDELPALDARERNYERCEVTGQLDVALDGRVWAYSGTRAGRVRAERGRRERRLAVASDYHERVMAGFELLDERGRFEALHRARASRWPS